MSNAIDGGAPETDSPVYHIVCHDCPTEFISRCESDAERHLSEHRASTGHNVEYADLSEASRLDRVVVENE